MRHDWRLVLGVFLTGAMAAAGCSSGSKTADAGMTGAGGAATGGADGGTDAGIDHGPATDAKADTAGAGGSTDAHADLTMDLATDTGAGDVAADVAMDMAVDTGSRDTAPCVTNYGAGNPVQFAFDGGANGGWNAFVKFDDSHLMFTTSLGASYTEGRMCAGSLLLGVNFGAYGTREAASIENYGFRDWTGYKALHAWIKVESADPSALNGVYFYATSGTNQAFYQSDFAAGASLSDWFEVVIDLTRAPNTGNGSGVMLNDVLAIGFETLLNTAPAVGAPVTPSEIFLLADDIWLEAAPPSDAGTGDANATDSGGQ